MSPVLRHLSLSLAGLTVLHCRMNSSGQGCATRSSRGSLCDISSCAYPRRFTPRRVLIVLWFTDTPRPCIRARTPCLPIASRSSANEGATARTTDGEAVYLRLHLSYDSRVHAHTVTARTHVEVSPPVSHHPHHILSCILHLVAHLADVDVVLVSSQSFPVRVLCPPRRVA